MMRIGLGLGLGFSSHRRGGDMKKYKLIDGAFFQKLCDEYSRYSDYEIFANVDWRLLGNAFRTTYYDAYPGRNDIQSDDDFKAATERKEKLFSSIRRTPYCDVQDGVVRLRTDERRSRVGARFEQKGVDTWIAVDAVKLALTQQADTVEIWTSDLDLYPAFEAIRQTNCRSHLRYSYERTSEDLVVSADFATPITVRDLVRLCAEPDERDYLVSGRQMDDPDEAVTGFAMFESFEAPDGDWRIFKSDKGSGWRLIAAGERLYYDLNYPVVLAQHAQHHGAKVDLRDFYKRVAAAS